MKFRMLTLLAALTVGAAALAVAPSASAQVAVSGSFGLPHGVVSFATGGPAYHHPGYAVAPVSYRRSYGRSYSSGRSYYRPYRRNTYYRNSYYYRPYRYRRYPRVYVQPYPYYGYSDYGYSDYGYYGGAYCD